MRTDETAHQRTAFRRAARRLHRSSGFTLVEIVIALTIVVVITAAAIPSFRGLRDEQLAREPITELVRMAKQARLKAMEEKRPYQIAFYPGGFSASRYSNPYVQLAELQEFLAMAADGRTLDRRRPDESDGEPDDGDRNMTTELPLAPPPPERDDQWTLNYELPADTRYSVQYWYDLEPLQVEGDRVTLWVFQPSGVCQPLTIRMDRPSVTFEVEFGALTADIVKEVTDIR
jgi:prepilin-type N-terminal cleavage/methylation domain-containing protein